MSKNTALITLLVVFLSFGILECSNAQNGDEGEVKEEHGMSEDDATGVKMGEPTPGVAPAAAPTCTLTVPATVNRGQSFSFTVSYNPCMNGGRVETFTFNWPSTLDRFTENTVREKVFFSAGCIGASFESALVPTAGAISGTAMARVVVRGEGFNCTADATMTVN